jgi:hypothetical protein
MAEPTTIDLRDHFPPAFAQAGLRSCAACAIASALDFSLQRQAIDEGRSDGQVLRCSPLFIYYNGRDLAGAAFGNVPMTIHNGLEGVASTGICSEDLWPYSVSALATRPSPAAYQFAAQRRGIRYARLDQTIDALRACLAAGSPVIFGFRLTARIAYSFDYGDVARTGRMPMPAPGEPATVGHAALTVGYDDAERRFIARNSLGPGWGMDGYFSVPYELMISEVFVHSLWWIQPTVPIGQKEGNTC